MPKRTKEQINEDIGFNNADAQTRRKACRKRSEAKKLAARVRRPKKQMSQPIYAARK
jgi:hypothetical protein